MSRDKQIEEMAWDLCDIPKHPSIKSCEQCGNKHCLAMYYAKRACNAGYRRASAVAREIFEEFKTEMRSRLHSVDELYKKDPDDFYGGQTWAYSAAIFVLENIIKKKYESEGADDEQAD